MEHKQAMSMNGGKDFKFRFCSYGPTIQDLGLGAYQAWGPAYADRS